MTGNYQEILKQLIQIKSYSGNENKLADFIIGFTKKNQLDWLKQDKNIVIKFLNNSKKCLIFNGHMDTVNEGNKNKWLYPPYGQNAGVIKNNKLYGLGASDMKAGLASFLTLATQLKKQKAKIDIFFSFVAQEETDGSGTNSFVSYFKKNHFKNYQQIAAVIAEPTDNKFVEIGHRGNVFIKLTTFGNSGHASQPQKIKIHAIEQMVSLISQIKEQNKVWIKKYEDKILGNPSFCLTSIKSEPVSPNKVPSWCSSIWDIRTTPKLHYQLEKILKQELGSKVKIEYFKKPAPYSLISDKEKIIKLFKKIVSTIEFKVSPAANDSYSFNNSGIPATTFGPGCKKMAHQENEYVILENIPKAVKVYQSLIQKF